MLDQLKRMRHGDSGIFIVFISSGRLKQETGASERRQFPVTFHDHAAVGIEAIPVPCIGCMHGRQEGAMTRRC
jgi:hypothetical protein